MTIVTDNEFLLQLLNLEGEHELHLCVELFIPKLQHLSGKCGSCGLGALAFFLFKVEKTDLAASLWLVGCFFS